MVKSEDFLKSSLLVRISAFALICFSFFYFGKNYWSYDNNNNAYQHLIFFNNNNPQQQSISISPNLIANQNNNNNNNIDLTLTPPPSNSNSNSNSNSSTPPPPPPIKKFGIIDENGSMTDHFEAEPPVVVVDQNWNNETVQEEVDTTGRGSSSSSSKVVVKKFPLCPDTMREYIPCVDNVEEIQKLKSTDKGEKYERHCPAAAEDDRLHCLVPTPQDYRIPIPWPKSRDEVWFANVPHTRLVEDKGGQNWITRVNDKFIFPGGGTQFIHGADQYLNQMSQMVPDIEFGRSIRVALDIGCGVASFGAYLLKRNVTTLSIAPKDVHENQIQFALERGVPAMLAVFATRRLLYPSQAFDLIHCSRCRINWTRDDGILLLELNRMLRAGGYFVWAAQPVYKHEEPLQEQWKEMEDLTTRLCWELVKKEGYIAIWRKPINNTCYEGRDAGTQPPLCEPDDDPDRVWYVDLKACISRLPDNGYGANVTKWPSRLLDPPDRLQSIQIDAYMSRKELFIVDTKYWNELIEGYVSIFHWKNFELLHNVMDMRAGFGGFAAALNDLQIDAWVLNVVPVSGPNTLPVIYDRGLIGVQHDWCEPFDTYPRTYDLLHAAELFSVERKRCNISTIMLEMDRMLRPGGSAYIVDTLSVMDELLGTAKAMGWNTVVQNTPEGPHASRRLLICEKRMLRP